MKALSIKQPWAHLILGIAPPINLSGFTMPKDVENRTWDTKYRGDILVHAGKKFDQDALEYLYGEPPPDAANWLRTNFTLGAVLGIVTLVDIVQNSESPWAQRNCYHWVLENPRPFTESFPYKGQLGLFNVPHELIKAEDLPC